MIIDARKAQAWALALVAAAVLIGLGYWLGGEAAQERLNLALADADHYNRQAARQAAINTQLQNRLTELERLLARSLAVTEAGPAQEVKSRLLRRGQAVILLGGALVATLEDVTLEPAMARIGLQNAGGEKGRAELAVGAETLIRASGRVYRLVLKKVTVNSATIALLAR
ncbi:hypothetical protein [Desulfarculus baarsii]